LVVSQIISFNLIPWSELGCLNIRVNKPYPHVVSLLVWIAILVSSWSESESIDDHLSTTNTWTCTWLKAGYQWFWIVLKGIFWILEMNSQILNELLPV
jgi:hypothetical protein